ncbi:MAG: D-alanyl-alanine synthetase [Alphaproteobacteria bacterium]|jgi:D-alanine-D-alanine ligase|nr:D-alanyl-alanine synthetase [Alphaproteobacteria bacterium]
MDGHSTLLQPRLDRLRDTLRLAVIYNGDRHQPNAVINRTHNPRSDKSYRSVAEDIATALRGAGFRHVDLLADDLTLVEKLRQGRHHFAWLNTAGVQGYDAVAHTPALLELAGIPYVGHRPLLAVTLDNKHVFKRELASIGLPTAPFLVCDGANDAHDITADPRYAATFGDHAGPFVVKPVSGRGSIGVTFVERRADIAAAVQSVYRTTLNQVMIEPHLPGREYCVSVCGRIVARDGQLRREAEPFAFSMLERLLGADEPIFTSMDVRPITLDRTRLLDARDPVHAELMYLARRVHNDFNLRTLVRLDLRADAAGRLHILEANPKPDLKRPDGKAVSLVCVGLAQHGMSYEDLVLSLLVDRLEFYLAHRPAAVQHIAELLA